MVSRARIQITGMVQGVGFRPYVFNLARSRGLFGTIQNKGNFGVEVVLEGPMDELEQFVTDLEGSLPSVAYIEDVTTSWEDATGEFSTLEIIKSATGRGKSLVLPPDIAICPDCMSDFRDKSKSRYYQYEFVACAACGPRFTTVETLPYDRERTTMQDFPFCPNCAQEYADFDDRRFHAQTFACRSCGPRYTLFLKNQDGSPEKIPEEGEQGEHLARAMDLLKEGKILAVKSLGGVHLVCRADEDEIVEKLRLRKRRRKNKPFALMSPDIETVRRFAFVSDREQDVLTSFRRPIVLLQQGSDYEKHFSRLVAPGLDSIGVLLPYMGLHLMFFQDLELPGLIFTSGNATNLPMATTNDEIFNQLAPLADAFLVHNRRIFQRCDDSVVKLVGSQPKIIRRSRGYVPEYIPLPFKCDPQAVIAVGPELHSTGAVLKLGRVFPTQHIGNVTHLETYQFLEEALLHMKALLDVDDREVSTIACDAHPHFYSTRLARTLADRFRVDLTPVFHHHAHAAALMVDNAVPVGEEIITLALDGVGFGEDELAWGGEVMSSNYETFERLAYLENLPMIGGDACVKYPGRMLASILFHALGTDEAEAAFKRLNLFETLPGGAVELGLMAKEFTRGHYPVTSSTGRVLDALAVLLGACEERTYDGEPALRFEALARGESSTDPIIDLPVTQSSSGHYIVRTTPLFVKLLERLPTRRYRDRARLARGSHWSLAHALARIASDLARSREIARVGLSGGVAYNSFIPVQIQEFIEKSGLKYIDHSRVPPGDAGVCVGQAAIAKARTQ